MNIGLLGHGIVGAGVDRIISGRKDMKVTRILSLVIDGEMAGRAATGIDEIVNDPAIDTVAECMGGVHPAFEFIISAMEHGKNVVTSNKAVVAACYLPLLEAAGKYGVSFRCGAAVGGGIPWLTNLERAKRIDRITEIGGVCNGTTNYILNAMEERGGSLEDLVLEAQRLGYAEKDPSADLLGLDVRRKLNISANVAFDTRTEEEEIPAFGIEGVTEQDIRNIKNMGRHLKLVSYARRNSDATVAAFVEPELISSSDPMSALSGSYNLLRYTGENCGTQSFVGQGAGRFPTAFNVVQDLLDIQACRPSFYAGEGQEASVDNSNVLRAYYIRSSVSDDFISSVTVSSMSRFRLTRPLPVSSMFAWLKEAKVKDPGLFFAGISEEESC